MALAEYSI
jgi:hypothetical protein